MQLGFVSAILPELSLESVLATAAEIGYECVELMCWPAEKADRRYAGVRHLEVEHFDDEAARHANELVSRHGVSISGLGYYPNLLSANRADAERFRQHLRKVIEAAALLGVGQVNTFAGRDPARSVADNWPRFLEIWGPLVEHATTCNVRIGIENCPMLFTEDEWPGGKNLASSPAIWRRMFDDLPGDRFGLNYDPSHLVWQQMDYLQPLEDFADRIFHVHAKDVRVDVRRRNQVGILAYPLEYHVPKLPGLGDIHWGQFFSVLGDTGYQGPVCVEVEDRVYENSLAARHQALQQSCDYLRQFVPRPEEQP